MCHHTFSNVHLKNYGGSGKRVVIVLGILYLDVQNFHVSIISRLIKKIPRLLTDHISYTLCNLCVIMILP